MDGHNVRIRPQPSMVAPLRQPTVLQKRKRGPRAGVACDTCRKLKAKCDQNMPCKTCEVNSEECIYRSNKSAKTQFDQSASNQGEGAHQASDSSRPSQQLNRSQTSVPGPTRNASASIQRRPGLSATGAESNTATRSSTDGVLHLGHAIGSDDNQPEPPDLQGQTADESFSEEEVPSPEGYRQTNSRTHGNEFYGPAATLAFLLELRARARAFRKQFPNAKQSQPSFRRKSSASAKSSLVDILDGDITDVQIPEAAISTPEARDNPCSSVGGSKSLHPTISPAFAGDQALMLSSRAVEKECINLYFTNLHFIYYFLDKNAFITRCEKEIWSPDAQSATSEPRRRRSPFPALFSAVVAVGALTAGDEIVTNVSPAETKDFWGNFARICGISISNPAQKSHLPMNLAHLYFTKAKNLLGDFFESCSLESQQTLFLMSIYCQYALKPHGSYMYNGMAARTAMAIGSSNVLDLKKNPIEAIRTWWCIYHHEMEVCCVLGRETFLREPDHYPVFLAKFKDPFPSSLGIENDEILFFARSMTELAHILKRTSEGIYHTGSSASMKPQADRYQLSLELDARLVDWKQSLKPIFDWEDTSLIEKESLTKKKIVMQLRYLSARIMIHRPFLVAAANQRTSGIFELNVQTCLEAARQTIQLLFDTFRTRPFFRTWWYNTTYAFNATSIILYALVARLYLGSSRELLADVEKTLKIFQAMDTITVARRCAELTEEIFEVAKLSPDANQSSSNAAQVPFIQQPQFVNTNIPTNNFAAPPPENMVGGMPTSASTDWNMSDAGYFATEMPQDDFLSTIMDPSLLDSFGANLNGLDMDESLYGGFDPGWNYGIPTT